MTQAPTYYGSQPLQADDPYAAYDPQVLDYESDPQWVADQGGVANATGAREIRRAKWLWLWFLIPFGLCGISYAAGGQPFLTDVGFIALTLICVLCFIRELIVFPRRFGVGGLLLFGGTLVWFCYDYLTNWMGKNLSGLELEPWVVTKAAFHHTLFVLFMVIGIQINKGSRWLERLMQTVPEPASNNLYFLMVLLMFFIGMIPYIFFTTDTFFEAIWKSMWAGRGGEGANFTMGRRAGNVNYDWGAYIERCSDVGMLGALLASFYAVMVSKQLWQQIVCWAIWMLWVMLAFGTGSRGFTVFLALPVVIMVFLKYNLQASQLMRRISFRAYVICAMIGAGVLILINVQGSFRNKGFAASQFKEVEVTKLEGNEMFTTTLIGMRTFPNEEPFFYNQFPGQGLIWAAPYELYFLVIGPIPRALWHEKPLDTVNVWYNNRSAGTRGIQGTTISNGAVGHPYIRFGVAGVIQFGLLYGWAMGVVERGIKRAMGRPMSVLMTLSFATFVFRSYRDLWWHNLYPVIIAGVAMFLLVKLVNTFFGGGEEQRQQQFAAA